MFDQVHEDFMAGRECKLAAADRQARQAPPVRVTTPGPAPLPPDVLAGRHEDGAPPCLVDATVEARAVRAAEVARRAVAGRQEGADQRRPHLVRDRMDGLAQFADEVMSHHHPVIREGAIPMCFCGMPGRHCLYLRAAQRYLGKRLPWEVAE